MSVSLPTVLALDFDGVLCDGLKEYFQTAWQAYRNLWHLGDQPPPEGVAERFYRLRPVVETGWEMPVVLRAIELGISDEDVLQNWGAIAQKIVQKENLEPARLASEVDGVRDRWIASNLDSWLAEHRCYPGVIDRLKIVLSNPIHTIIISTKEKRFIEKLLHQQGVDLTHLRIYGKEMQRPKHQILRELMLEYGRDEVFWFVEDRLKTLQAIQKQSDLQGVLLFLADWGYNTPTDREVAEGDPTIHRISIEQFSQDFDTWL
ncbi:HAD family hydrolase [Leptothermofonsia sp. ETS-13]|uniref:HAD family hydrolase n=1 Tax=Leptothermofonsia sp. ETS-13 TaxID=3035696 RepID=UPI003B9FB9F9